MTKPHRLLYIVFARADSLPEQLQDVRRRPWTAPKSARQGDVALFYFGGGVPGIHAIGRTAEDSHPGVPDPNWTDSATGYFARHADVETLQEPVPLAQIRRQFPDWGRWRSLRGVRVHMVPEPLRAPLAALVSQANAAASSLLEPWLSGASPETSGDGPRAIVTVRRQLRDSSFGRRVRSASGGLCSACRGRTNFESLGVLEAAHIRPVADGGRDTLSNALALCPNHHALLDEGKWTVRDHSITLSTGLPMAVVKTFAAKPRCTWALDRRCTAWHNQNTYKGKG